MEDDLYRKIRQGLTEKRPPLQVKEIKARASQKTEKSWIQQPNAQHWENRMFGPVNAYQKLNPDITNKQSPKQAKQ